MDTRALHADTIRQSLIKRAEAYSAKAGCSLSFIGDEALRDGKFIGNVKNGANFTLRTYQRVMDWLDHAEAGAKQSEDA